MDPQTASELLEINRRFYSEFGDAFAATRRRIQPGVNRILETIPPDVPSDWLDLGCGSGALGRIWSEQGRCGSYTGVDFSGPLLREAEKATEGLSGERLRIRYLPGDLMDPDWTKGIGSRKFDGVLAFASLHHIPGKENHLRIFRQVRDLLKEEGDFIFSVWQFQNSPKLMNRVQPWDRVGIPEEALEQGDTLLDWRFALPENGEKQGLRYVHLFSEEEIGDLADRSGLRVTEQFYSDGAEGNLALYTRVKTV
ncbi:MAG: class I SAM-dependent methyltransferase [Flexilinea sp.]|nr:class I SAM-dependent methyltransferase [Flexilinea sp.]